MDHYAEAANLHGDYCHHVATYMAYKWSRSRISACKRAFHLGR